MSLSSLYESTFQSRGSAWTTVNAVCFLASVWLLLWIVWGDRAAKVAEKQAYLFYNVLTTAVWCWEVIVVRKDQKWATIVEAVLAVFFLGDSVTVLLDWKFQNQHLKLMFVELSFNVVGFGYFVYTSRSGNEGYEDIRTVGTEEEEEIDGVSP